MMTLLKLRRGKYSLVEEKVPAGAKAIGVALKDMGLPKECVIAAVIRKGKITLPHGDFTFVEDDEVLAITDPLAAQQLSALLTPPDFRERGK
jgi:trk system potassium uptake protein TrkA